MLRQTHEAIGHAISLLEGADKEGAARILVDLVTAKHDAARFNETVSGAKIIEGVFDGLSMIGPNGTAYAVPSNYASKSRLVEGDVMKLTIRSDGTRIFKQIGPVERRRSVGCVAVDSSTGMHVVVCGQMTYKVLPASMTFFQAEPGDEVVVLVPKSRDSVWAAVENIVKK
ncbi:hypothetical protein A2348_01540 [Candidatus Uhrbacteria bacterium RIFOXYB12_FULL_58_10]|nr:MAG: hypothetical protein A2348_01540 [Candidatus Uhrbacteria bacterium RIFOXYB12_FULL_58_10]OGL99704.1 MAG: hypothetical protein A2501_00405 [Candidatus Uhrbacteria bacterium RIFOXYC12_FULL_57_11]